MWPRVALALEVEASAGRLVESAGGKISDDCFTLQTVPGPDVNGIPLLPDPEMMASMKPGPYGLPRRMDQEDPVRHSVQFVQGTGCRIYRRQVLQQVTGKNSTERFIDKRYVGDVGLQSSGMAIESTTVYIQTDIACSVRRHVQLPADSPVAPGPTGYQQRFAQFLGAL